MQLHYKSFGQGDPIIILHGLFGTSDNWQTIAKKLAQHYLVYIVDQRNHGRSAHADEISYVHMTEDLNQFMEQQWIYQAHVIGHSMGGKTAMKLALTYPEMVEKLMIIDIAPKTYPSHHQSIFDALLSLDLSTLNSRNEAANILKQKIADPLVIQFLLKNLSRNKAGKYEWKMNLEAIYRHYSKILEMISGDEPFFKPTLFVRGGISDYISDTDWSEIKRLFPKAELATMPQAGHWIHAEKPEEFLQQTLDFLKA